MLKFQLSGAKKKLGHLLIGIGTLSSARSPIIRIACIYFADA